MNRRLALGWALVILAALALRLPQLASRPMHGDEAVHATKFRDLWEHGRYVYDPNEYHGPTLYYATLLSAWLSPARGYNDFDEVTYRLVPVAFGVGLILLSLLLADGLGRGPMLCAGALTALSPAMVFYSRYYIHEMLLVFFTALLIVAEWRYTRSGRIGWRLLAGAAVGLMYATKETFVLAVGALVLALAAALAWGRVIDRERPNLKLNWQRFGAAAGSALAVSLLFFSSFFTNVHGPLDAVRTYLPWLNRAGGASPHRNPWDFYFERLLFFHQKGGPYWSEGLIAALALIGLITILAGKGWPRANLLLARTIAFYTLILTGIYTALSYKTPWCLLGFWHGAILLAGVGTVALLRWPRRRWGVVTMAVALGVGGIQLGWQAWRASGPENANRQNPYVYAHPSTDVLTLVEKVEALAQVSPKGTNLVVKVMAQDSDYWPLPWYLRRFKNVGWWDRIPAEPLAPIMIVSSKFQAAFDERPNKTHLMAGYFQLRPQVFLELYVEINHWRDYVAAHPPKPD